MTGNVIDLQRYRTERRDRAPAVQAPVGVVVLMVPAIYCMPVMVMPTAFMPSAMTVPAW